MPAQLKERLRDIIDRASAIPSAVGITTLAMVSLTLPDFRGWPKLFEQFASAADALAFFRPKIAPFLLICATVFWFYRFKGAVINELGQLNESFEENNAPRYFGHIDSHRSIPYISYALGLTFCALILAAPYIWLYCLVALLLHALDLTGSAMTLQTLNKIFLKFPVSAKSESRNIAERREVLKNYYFGHPTLPRIAALLLVTAAAMVLAILLPPALPEPAYYVPYALMIANIVVGEWIIHRWRAERDRALDAIALREEDQALA